MAVEFHSTHLKFFPGVNTFNLEMVWLVNELESLRFSLLKIVPN